MMSALAFSSGLAKKQDNAIKLGENQLVTPNGWSTFFVSLLSKPLSCSLKMLKIPSAFENISDSGTFKLGESLAVDEPL